MRDHILDCLRSAGKILLDVLQLHTPSDEAAGKILGAILGGD